MPNYISEHKLLDVSKVIASSAPHPYANYSDVVILTVSLEKMYSHVQFYRIAGGARGSTPGFLSGGRLVD